MDNGGNPQAQTPPGWYDDGFGRWRWWDGNAWSETVAPATVPNAGTTSDPKTIAALMHVSAIFFGFLGPLVGYLVFPNDPFVREHSRQALNFQLTLLIGFVVSFALIFVFIGIITFFVLIVAALVLEIMGAIAASKGEQFSYPLTIPFLKS